MAIPIYYITEDKDPSRSEEAISAQAMAKASNSNIQQFLQPKSGLFKNGKKTTAPNELILLAHTDTGRPPSTIGDKSPKELAKDFRAMFSQPENITDIFLISCEAGMGAPSLAQQFASEMVKNGFKHIHIHAVAHPDGKLIGGGVEVTTATGTITGGTIGQVNGYFYGTQESKEYHQYLNTKRSSVRKTDQDKKLDNTFRNFDRTKAIIVNLVTDLEDMRAPYNTFTKDGPLAKISADIAITLNFLKEKKKTLIDLNGGDTDVTRVIDQIITTLEANSTFNRDQIIDVLRSRTTGDSPTLVQRAQTFMGVNPVPLHLRRYTSELDSLLNRINGIPVTDSNQADNEESPLLRAQDQVQGQTNNIENQLSDYVKQRKDEWGFHWDFLYLKTLSFWVSDCISSIAKNMGLLEESTDYLNIKSRETKVNAANKLIERLNGNPVGYWTQDELRAVRDGRLGLIANSIDNLDELLATSPAYQQANRLQPG